MRPGPPFQNPDVQAIFEAYPEPVRARLLALRALIFETAAEMRDVGRVEEALRWGEPAYLTVAPKSGTTMRLDSKAPSSGEYALYVHCQTDLIAQIQARHGEQLRYEGERALRFHVDEVPPTEVLRDCVALALTYHLRRRRGSAGL